MKKLILALMMLSAATALAAKDPNDAEGVEEHPDIPRMPGFYINDGEANDFNAYTFPTSNQTDENGDLIGVTKEGRQIRVHYYMNEGTRPVSTVALFRNFENAVKKAGGTVVHKHTEGNGGHLVLKQKTAKSERWIHVSRPSSIEYTITVIDVAAMEQQLEISATDMLEAIDKNGFVMLHGILFDTGKDVIKPESEPLLAEIVTLMQNNKKLKISVEGHTDNVGDKKANQALSARRAESVRKYLVSKGVDAKRLKAAGRGDTIPVADNRLEDGRAKNRRVELVKF